MLNLTEARALQMKLVEKAEANEGIRDKIEKERNRTTMIPLLREDLQKSIEEIERIEREGSAEIEELSRKIKCIRMVPTDESRNEELEREIKRLNEEINECVIKQQKMKRIPSFCGIVLYLNDLYSRVDGYNQCLQELSCRRKRLAKWKSEITGRIEDNRRKCEDIDKISIDEPGEKTIEQMQAEASMCIHEKLDTVKSIDAITAANISAEKAFEGERAKLNQTIKEISSIDEEIDAISQSISELRVHRKKEIQKRNETYAQIKNRYKLEVEQAKIKADKALNEIIERMSEQQTSNNAEIERSKALEKELARYQSDYIVKERIYDSLSKDYSISPYPIPLPESVAINQLCALLASMQRENESLTAKLQESVDLLDLLQTERANLSRLATQNQ